MMDLENVAVSIITPTQLRPVNVGELVENLTAQTLAGLLRGASRPRPDPCASS
jgi:hypothetical protein